MNIRRAFPLRAASAALLTVALVGGFAAPPAHPAETLPESTAETPPAPEWVNELQDELAQHPEPAPTAAEAFADEEPPLCDVTWVGGWGGRWDIPGNWSPSAVPTSSQVACATDSEIVVPTGYSADVGRLIADAAVVIEGSLVVREQSSIQELYFADRSGHGTAPRLGIGEGTALTVQALESANTTDAAIYGGTIVVEENFQVHSSWLSITSFLITEPESKTNVGGSKSHLELFGGATLWGEWTIDVDNYVGVNTRTGWGQPSSLTGEGELEALEGSRILMLDDIDLGTLLVGGEVVIESEGSAELDYFVSDGTMNRPGFRSYRVPCPAITGWADSRSA